MIKARKLPVRPQFTIFLPSQGRVAFLPFCEISLKTANPKPYPTNPQTIGDHLKKRRHELGMYQKDAAALLGVNPCTLIGWKKGRKDPAIQFWPRVTKFLGCDPHGEPKTLSDRLLAVRRRLGVTQEEAAKLASVDEESFRLWELGKRKPSPASLMRIEEFIAKISRRAWKHDQRCFSGCRPVKAD